MLSEYQSDLWKPNNLLPGHNILYVASWTLSLQFHRVWTKSEGSRFFRTFYHRRPCYLNINLTYGSQTTYCPGIIFYTLLRGPYHYSFIEFERNPRGRDFSELSLIGVHVIWISIWPLELKQPTARARYSTRFFADLITTASPSLNEIWGVAIFPTFLTIYLSQIF